MMNVEEYKDYCLLLGEDVEEKLPFVKFKKGDGVLVFYVCGHMFCFFDLNDFQVVSLKCQPERIDELKAQYDCIGNPYNESPKHWIGLDPHTSPDTLTKDLIRKPLQCATIYTMNAPEALLEPLHYDIILGESNRVLGIFGGQPEMLCSHEIYQFNDYSKYETAMDEPTRAHIRETRFPQDLQKAYELGKRLVEKAKEQ